MTLIASEESKLWIASSVKFVESGMANDDCSCLSDRRGWGCVRDGNGGRGDSGNSLLKASEGHKTGERHQQEMTLSLLWTRDLGSWANDNRS